MHVLSALTVCAVAAATLAGCSSHDSPVAAPPVSAPAPTDTAQTSDPSAAQLLKAITDSPLADKVMSRAWNGDVMQVSVRSDRSTVHDQMRLCTELAGEFGDGYGYGYGIKQILVTVTTVDTGDISATASPLPEVRWNAKDRTCAQEPA